MKFTCKSSGIPDGTYPVNFTEAEASTNDFGYGVVLRFEVINGEHVGETTTRIVSQKLSPKSGLFKFVTALGGRKLEPGEEIDLTSFYGVQGLAIVAETDSGSSRVESFVRMS